MAADETKLIRVELKLYMKELEKTQEEMSKINERLSGVKEGEIRIEESLKFLTMGVEDIKKQLHSFEKGADKKFVTQEQFKPYKAILGIIGTAAVLNYVNDILNLI